MFKSNTLSALANNGHTRRKSEGRRGSDSRKEGGSAKQEEGGSRRRRVRTNNMKITFENILASVSAIPSDTLTKDSVAEMVKSVYTWMVFDPDAQISLPTGSGTSHVQKMWPHGAVVDSRRSGPYRPQDGDRRALEDLEEDMASTVATSVISSTVEQEKLIGHIGNITLDPADAQLQYQSQQFVGNRESSNMVPRPENFPPPSVHYDNDPTGYASAPRVHQPAPVRNNISSGRYVPRFSVVGGSQTPINVPDTPEETKVQRPVRRVPKAKPKVGSAPREINEESGGFPVNFVE